MECHTSPIQNTMMHDVISVKFRARSGRPNDCPEMRSAPYASPPRCEENKPRLAMARTAAQQETQVQAAMLNCGYC
eukprot:1144232-Pelagomonas_calceolata.AAC.5